MNKLPEIKIVIPSEKIISAELKNEGRKLELQAAKIKSVSSADENDLAGKSVTSMRKHVKQVESERKAITKPLDDAKALVKGHCDEHCAVMLTEIDRIQNLGTNYIRLEKQRVAEEEEKRRKEFEAAQAAQFNATTTAQEMIAKRKVNAVINAPEPEMEKAKGQQFRNVLKHRVIDIHAIYKCRPELVKLEISVSAVNATCHPNIKVDGLELWFEPEARYTSR